jgi:vacuolar-type H+-ATPase subunit D/Vma8
MSTKTQITEEQLKDLQQKIATIQQIQGQVGTLEGQKHILLHQLVNAQDELQKLQIALEDEYGKVSINIQDGTLEEIKDEEAQG